MRLALPALLKALLPAALVQAEIVQAAPAKKYLKFSDPIKIDIFYFLFSVLCYLYSVNQS
jgi:hypothetical protein